MSEDKKYPIQGTVTISAEEYRDLILAAEQHKNAASSIAGRIVVFLAKFIDILRLILMKTVT